MRFGDNERKQNLMRSISTEKQIFEPIFDTKNWIVDKNCIEENVVAFDVISFGLLEPRSHSRFNIVNMNRIISVNEIDEI